MVQWNKIFTPAVRKWGGICATAFLVGYGACFGMYRYTQRKILLAPHSQDALQILLSHKEAIEALGPPIGLDARFNFADRRSYRVDEKKKTFWMKLPVAGKIDSGNVYVNGIYDGEDNVQVTSMDLSLHRLEKRFRIFELDEDDIKLSRPSSKRISEDDDELDEEVLPTVEKRKWFFSWPTANTNA